MHDNDINNDIDVEIAAIIDQVAVDDNNAALPMQVDVVHGADVSDVSKRIFTVEELCNLRECAFDPGCLYLFTGVCYGDSQSH